MTTIKTNDIIAEIKTIHLNIKELEANCLYQDYSIVYAQTDQVQITLKDLSELLNIESSDVISSLDLTDKECDLLIDTALLLKNKSDILDNKISKQKFKIKTKKDRLVVLIQKLKEIEKSENELIIDKNQSNKLSYVSIKNKHFTKEEMDAFLNVLLAANVQFIETNARICFLFEKYEDRKDIRDKIVDHFCLLPIEYQKNEAFLKFKERAQESQFNFANETLLKLL